MNFLITAVLLQIFYPTTELAIPMGIPINEAKAEIETHLMIVETKTRNCTM